MEFSSRRIFDDETQAPTSQSHDLPSDLAAISLGDSADNNDDTQTNFLDIINVIDQYEVPSIDLTYIGVVTTQTSAPITTGSSLEQPIKHTPVRFGYNLGAGYSARVIRHTTNKDVLEVSGDEVVVRAKTVVALKKITVRPSVGGASDSIVKAEAYQSILQEIKVSRHPLLKQHENLAKLLYVGWEQQETFPLIALELAAFGTLEDILTAPGEGPTYRQKLNLTIDIALGIAALHHFDIIHGDLKPANILVQHHPQRQIVAQISDFGGSFEVASGHDAPSIGTTLWSAPEVVFGIRDIDWKRADAWTYGLIIVSIWSHFPFHRKSKSSCYLDKVISEHVDGNLRNARIQLLKTEHDASPTSILSRCRRSASIMGWVYTHSLSSINSNRKTIGEIIADDLTPACIQVNRRLVHIKPHVMVLFV
jgi:serine/threonine protein kinase